MPLIPFRPWRAPPGVRHAFAPRLRSRWLSSISGGEIEPRFSTQQIFVLKIEIFDVDGDPQVFYFSTKAMVSWDSDCIPQTTLRELVVDPGTIKRQVFTGSRSGGVVAPTWGQIELKNTGGDFDSWLDYSTDGGKVTCWYGPYGGVFPAEFRKVYIAYIDGSPNIDSKTARFAIRGREKLFDRQVVKRGFNGDSGSVGGIPLEVTGIPGQRLQALTIGAPGYFEPILLNDLDSIWWLQGNPMGELPGGFRLFDGGVELENDGSSIGTAFPGGYALHQIPSGAIYLRTGSVVRVGLRAYASGLFGNATVTPRPWTVCDLATMAGIGGIDANNLPIGSENLSGGNRRVETQTFKDVFNDIAQFEVASIGFNRLDQFYARRIVPSFDGTPVYTFRDGGSRSDGNSREWTWAPIPGLEKRVWKLKVSAGETTKCPLAGVIDDDIRDALSRDPWNVNFTANVTYNSGVPWFQASTILDTDPTAEIAEVQIVGNEFPSEAEMEAFALRYMRLYGAKQTACWLETEFNLDTMALDLLDCVTLQTNRFGGNRSAVIWAIDANLKARKIRFGCWSHRQSDAPTAGEITIEESDFAVGAGGSGAGSGATGQGEEAPQDETFYIAASDETTALTTGIAKRTWICTYEGGFFIKNLIATLTTPQTSGSIFTVDVNVNGSTILSTKLTIDNTEYTSGTAATAMEMTSQTLLFGDRVSIDVDQIGDGTAKGLSVAVIGYRL